MAYHVTLESNVKSIMENGLVPQLGPRASQIEREPAVYLFPTYEDYENAITNWLGDEFDDTNPDEPLVLLQVDLPAHIQHSCPVEWEIECKETIPPQYISFHSDLG